jgi:hypothetical protein
MKLMQEEVVLPINHNYRILMIANVSVSNASILSVWNLYYRTIALANTIINKAEAGSLTNKQFVLAEAKFMRAYLLEFHYVVMFLYV